MGRCHVVCADVQGDVLVDVVCGTVVPPVAGDGVGERQGGFAFLRSSCWRLSPLPIEKHINILQNISCEETSDKVNRQMTQ